MIKADKIFYAPELQGDVEKFILSEEESWHATKVLRLPAGEHIHLINGTGGMFEAEIVNPHQKRCEVKIIHSIFDYEKRPFRLHIAIAPTKMNERMEWFAEKATEIGIDEITPIICRHSERKELKLARFEKIILAAAKQSVKAYLPKINPVCTFDQIISTTNENQRFIAHCYEQDKKLLKDICEAGKEVLILIGPEGDFCPDEIEKALSKDFIPVSLGNSRLRTETAGIVACHTVNLINED